MITRRNARLVLLVLCLALTVMPSIRTVSSTQAPGPMEASSTADTAEAAPAGSIICCSTKSGETSLIDIATGEVQNLTFSGSSIEISPDRKTLAYVDGREQLHVYYLDTGRDVGISDPEDLEKYGSPTFVSNDTIAYIKRNRTYRTAIYTTRIDRLDERTWVGERGLLQQDIYDPSRTERSVGSVLFGIGIMRRDGTPVQSVCGVDGKPVLTPGDYIAWR